MADGPRIFARPHFSTGVPNGHVAPPMEEVNHVTQPRATYTSGSDGPAPAYTTPPDDYVPSSPPSERQRHGPPRNIITCFVLLFLLVGVIIGASVGGALAVVKKKEKAANIAASAASLCASLAATTTTTATRTLTLPTPACATPAPVTNPYVPLAFSAVQSLQSKCPSDVLTSRYVGNTYQFVCIDDTDSGGYDIMSFTAYTMQQCVDTCAQYNAMSSRNAACKGVAWSGDVQKMMRDRWGANCWLKSYTAKGTGKSGTTLFKLVQ